MDTEKFRQVKALFGTMDDLCQERRRLYTGWAGERISPSEFTAAMQANLARTRESALELERLLGQANA